VDANRRQHGDDVFMATGYARFGAREGVHDDLVLAMRWETWCACKDRHGGFTTQALHNVSALPLARCESTPDPLGRHDCNRCDGSGRSSTSCPQVQRLNPTMPDDQVLEMAESMAELRLLDEETG